MGPGARTAPFKHGHGLLRLLRCTWIRRDGYLPRTLCKHSPVSLLCYIPL